MGMKVIASMGTLRVCSPGGSWIQRFCLLQVVSRSCQFPRIPPIPPLSEGTRIGSDQPLWALGNAQKSHLHSKTTCGNKEWLDKNLKADFHHQNLVKLSHSRTGSLGRIPFKVLPEKQNLGRRNKKEHVLFLENCSISKNL